MGSNAGSRKHVYVSCLVVAIAGGSGGCAQRGRASSPELSAGHPPVASPDAHAHGQVVALDEAARQATPLDGLGDYTRPVATRRREAQVFFDQGIRLYWAFNHDEAYLSFAKATALDPRCSMCFWGAALALGPNYNMAMLEGRARIARGALARALELSASGPPVERALARALERRYPSAEPVDEGTMLQRNRAYADAMRGVVTDHPDDPEVLTLFAEALMVDNPWKLWSKGGEPAPHTLEIVTSLERALRGNVDHPGANHLYIHALEASPEPAKALPSAERLGAMMPDAGHLVHMPAHVYQRIGRYHDAAVANRRAIAADRRYVAAIAPRAPPKVYEMYMAHNPQFLAYSDAMLGRSGEGIAAARLGGRVTREGVAAMPMTEHFAAMPHMMMVRFGRWREVLAEPGPDPSSPTAAALAHHARGMALEALGRTDEARQELEHLKAIAEELLPERTMMQSPAKDVLAIAALVLEGKLHEHSGDVDAALARLRGAVAMEDALPYDEPQDWWYPARHVLGAALLAARRPDEAERVYRADLERHPENGWALSGLAKALGAQGRKDEGRAVMSRARAAWAHADVPLAGSWIE